MSPTRPRFQDSARAISSVHSAVLLFAFAIVLSIFMAIVIFLNGAAA
ncbi:hypothetical protein G6M89_14205 [Natronolimnobius sp. AArcel1]|nr:archaellin/type IV pilin N-terminal domain-containing protein [Natronolimnobius sp. AArcel1]NGM70146.1 hypothetical protein [Natronolimnobius sp. AArcel1]